MAAARATRFMAMAIALLASHSLAFVLDAAGEPDPDAAPRLEGIAECMVDCAMKVANCVVGCAKDNRPAVAGAPDCAAACSGSSSGHGDAVATGCLACRARAERPRWHEAGRCDAYTLQS